MVISTLEQNDHITDLKKNWYGITIPFHKEFKTKTAKTIVKQICKIENLSEEDFIAKYKLKF